MRNMIRLKANKGQIAHSHSGVHGNHISHFSPLISHFRACTLIIFLTSHLSFLTSHAALSDRYNDQHPIIVECDMTYAPYAFLNEQGQPDGFFMDLLTTLLEELDLPYQIAPQENYMGRMAFLGFKSDIICDHIDDYDPKRFFASKFPVAIDKVVAAAYVNSQPLTSIKDLKPSDLVTLKHHDYVERLINSHKDSVGYSTIRHAPREGLSDVIRNKSRCYVWEAEPLKWHLHALRIDEIRLDELADAPMSQLHIIGHDKELIDALDDQYARLQQQGKLQIIQDKWFHPERKHNDTSYVAVFVLLILAAVGLIIFLLSRLMKRRLRMAVEQANDLKYMMEKALDMGDYYVTQHDLENHRVYSLHNNVLHLPKEGMLFSEFANHVPRDQRNPFTRRVQELGSGQLDGDELNTLWHASTDDRDPWRQIRGHSIVEYEDGKPRYIVTSAKDVTQELEDEQRDHELGERFFKLFDTNLIAMSFYSPDGMLININQNMRSLCGLDNESTMEFFRSVSFFDTDIMKGDIEPGTHEVFHACQRMYYPEIGLDKYIEIRIAPSFDDTGNLVYYITTARDVTAERELHRSLQSQERAMRQANESISKYEHELEFLLENSDMYVWQIDLVTRNIIFSRTPRKMEFSMNRSDYIQYMVEEEREQAERNFMAMIMKGEDFNAIHHFSHLPPTSYPCWYALSGIPSRNADGQLTSYFGVARNITSLMQAQQRLKQETERAENSGRLKSAFLANMSHEIRTPLNAIVGFSDLLPMVDTQAERMEFIRTISNNCDMLLRLINDILEASDMSTGAITITPAEVDFTQVFNDISLTLEQRVQNPNVQFIKDNPYESFVTTLDKGRMQQVITNFVTNAVKYTKEGHIKVGYRAMDTNELSSITQQPTPNTQNGLFIYCEDTGAGIPKDKQASVFERFVKLNDFVQGTGLGLSICKAIAERCNGKIGVTSEGEGHGSTFWIWIPCEMRNEK